MIKAASGRRIEFLVSRNVETRREAPAVSRPGRKAGNLMGERRRCDTEFLISRNVAVGIIELAGGLEHG
jgi:hypothetical protein